MTPQELIEYKNRSPNVPYHKFVLISNILGDSVLYCFFEGKEDPSYYLSRISSYFDNCEPIVCNGRDNVIAIFSKIKSISKYKGFKIGYFIDRDFGPPINIPGIYQTPTYSIENFYCSSWCFSRLLKNEFHITTEDSAYKKCMDFFMNRQNEFNDSILFFNAWYYCVRVESLKQNLEFNTSLNDNLPKGFVRFNLPESISQLYSLHDIKKLFPQALDVTEEVIAPYKSELEKSNRVKTLRGKYELQFLKKLLRFFIQDANTRGRQDYVNTKTKFNFQDALIVSQISQYADTPSSLKRYLSNLGRGMGSNLYGLLPKPAGVLQS
jgi:hypothetical protein